MTVYIKKTNTGNWGVFQWGSHKFTMTRYARCNCPNCTKFHPVPEVTTTPALMPLFVHKDHITVIRWAIRNLSTDTKIEHLTCY